MTTTKIDKCHEKKCLLQDREEDISIYITDEITALIQRLEAKNPDVHKGCLHVMVKNHLEFESLKIWKNLVVKYNPESANEVGVS